MPELGQMVVAATRKRVDCLLIPIVVLTAALCSPPLSRPMQREAKAGEPQFVEKQDNVRTPQEEIAYWIIQLRDLRGQQLGIPGQPIYFAFGGAEPTPADRLVAIGPAAIPQLIEALTDDTPTRTIAWRGSQSTVVRRQDIALKCLERIVGCRFYEGIATSMYLSKDATERREAVLANIRKWWKESEGKNQATMIRNQLALREKNTTLRRYDEIVALETLAMLEGPQAVVERGQILLAEDRYGLNSPVVELMEKIDPQSVVRGVMSRFWANKSQDGDYRTLLKYGDREVYREMTRRFEQTGKLDPGTWNIGDQVWSAAKHGRNWAIPIAARMLRETKMTGGRSTTDGRGSQPCSTADIAIESFSDLTGRDFGYDRDGSVEARLDAIAKAHRWWEQTGRDELKDVIAADHEPVINSGDLFATDDEIQAQVKVIGGGAPAARKQLLSTLGTVYSWRIQTALVDALAKTDDLNESMSILKVLNRRPSPWMLPTLASAFENPKLGSDVRLLAGQTIRDVVAIRGDSRRLETRDAALDAARKVIRAEATSHPQAMRNQAEAILQAWGQWDDLRLIESCTIPE